MVETLTDWETDRALHLTDRRGFCTSCSTRMPCSWTEALDDIAAAAALIDALNQALHIVTPLFVPRDGWQYCEGSNQTGHALGHHNRCSGCGAMFAAVSDGYVPPHYAPTFEAIHADVTRSSRPDPGA